ncbi:ABC transporter ATP-binding protein [Celeribacter marinus]|uniref:Macrolide export ATP-binding/permease protein MacB n=1 Tax=Celeribacter marinus TaxID=1397108 RepID=A0A0P0AAH2_9RHOB|nr:ABC transporter ATP-binding protein [Celeribacter marinus]ALI54905.1 macrolide export ATP-binding/permease protein MacB [Celeribacter marinus]SFK01516.1 putative ABC transport system ATP-binding protein [Celeribacter marinus]
MTDRPPVIELRGVTKVYGHGEAQVRAMNGVDITIAPGEFVAIMGPSGSGKSTTMNMIGCLDSPTSGEYLFNGVQVASLTQDQRAMLRRNYLGFVFQGFNLLARTSALDNVELPMIYKGLPASERREKALDALGKVGLGGREHHDPSELSGGQQQRAAIARALAGNPQVILADEPTGNLDTKLSVEIMELLKTLNERDHITIVMVTHEEDMAAYAHRVIWMVDGRVERTGEPHEVFSHGKQDA